MRESRDSIRFLINTQVQSHTLLRRGFGTSVPFIYICKRNHNILNWLWNYPFLCWLWGYDALHVWKIDYWKAKGIPLVVKVCIKPTIQDLNVKIQVGINSCHNSLWFSYVLIQWKCSQYKNFLKYLKGSHSGVWKYLIWLFSLFLVVQTENVMSLPYLICQTSLISTKVMYHPHVYMCTNFISRYKHQNKCMQLVVL